MAQTSPAEKKKSVSTTSLQALWDSSNHLDVQHSYLTAKQTRAEGCRLKIDWGALRGNQLGCSLTLPHKYWDKEEIPATVTDFLATYDSPGPTTPPPLSSFIHLPLCKFIFHIHVGVPVSLGECMLMWEENWRLEGLKFLNVWCNKTVRWRSVTHVPQCTVRKYAVEIKWFAQTLHTVFILSYIYKVFMFFLVRKDSESHRVQLLVHDRCVTASFS